MEAGPENANDELKTDLEGGVDFETPEKHEGHAYPVLLGVEGPLKNQRFNLDKKIISIGRDMNADILLRDSKVSRRHAHVIYDNIHQGNESPECRIYDTGSVNGAFVNDVRVGPDGILLQEKDRIRIGRSIFAFFVRYEGEASLDEKLAQMVMRDSLTGLLTIGLFMQVVEREIARATRYDRKLSLLLISIDSFLEINEKRGRDAGAAILKQTAELLGRFCRVNDLASRLRSDAIAVILPETDAAGAQALAKRICNDLAKEDFQHANVTIDVTASIGVVEWTWDFKSVEAMIGLAERALHEAQHKGPGSVAVLEAKDMTTDEEATKTNV